MIANMMKILYKQFPREGDYAATALNFVGWNKRKNGYSRPWWKAV